MASTGALCKVLLMRFARRFFGKDDSGSRGLSIHADGDRGGDSMFLHGYADKVVGGLH